MYTNNCTLYILVYFTSFIYVCVVYVDHNNALSIVVCIIIYNTWTIIIQTIFYKEFVSLFIIKKNIKLYSLTNKHTI